jgi:hypothetical protein
MRRHYWVYRTNEDTNTQDTGAQDTNTEYSNVGDDIIMIESNLENMKRAIQGIDEIIANKETVPAWVLDKIAVTKAMLASVWEYLQAKSDTKKLM